MQGVTLTILTFLAGFSAAQLDLLPQCAQSCVGQLTSGSQIGECSNLDPECICESEGFLSAITCCVSDSCNEADQQATLDFATSFCSIAGVTNLPTTVGCASATSATASATSSSTTSTTTPTSTPSDADASATDSAGVHVMASIGVGLIGAVVGVVAMM